MTRMTIRLPETLHTLLQQQANREGLSLNQFILYSLTRQSAFAHSIEMLPVKDVLEQQARFYTLLQTLGPAMTDAEWDTFLQNRTGRPKRAGVSAATENKLREKIANARNANAN